MKITTEKRVSIRSLPCPLTNGERLDFGAKNARSIQELIQTEQAQKEAASAFKARIECHKAEIQRISAIINSGHEWRETECEESIDWDTNMMVCVRLDTGEQVDIRPLTREERQLRMEM